MISLKEWYQRFPDGTHTQGCCFKRVTPPPPREAIAAGYPDDMVIDWPSRLIMGFIGSDWLDDQATTVHHHEITLPDPTAWRTAKEPSP